MIKKKISQRDDKEKLSLRDNGKKNYSKKTIKKKLSQRDNGKKIILKG